MMRLRDWFLLSSKISCFSRSSRVTSSTRSTVSSGVLVAWHWYRYVRRPASSVSNVMSAGRSIVIPAPGAAFSQMFPNTGRSRIFSAGTASSETPAMLRATEFISRIFPLPRSSRLPPGECSMSRLRSAPAASS